MEQKIFDFTNEPGKSLEKPRKYETMNKPVVSVIMPFYNDKDYIEQSVNCILNQTFPLFELLIVDDGSTDKESLDLLSQIEKIDNRIKVLHKQNEGLAATRDYGANHSSSDSKYLMFLDSDDIIDKTFIECAYWTLETNKEASWAYSDVIGFGEIEYLWNKWFDSEKMKKVNDLVESALIRKEAFFEVKGYELREKAVNEDWNFWLKLIAKGKFPVHMNYYGMWYRRKAQGELAKSIANKTRSLEIINNTAKTIKKPVKAIQYPKQDYNWDGIVENINGMILPQYEKDDKINILMIIPWMITGGADKFNLDLVKGLDKNKFNITIVLTEPNKNVLRQEFEKYATVYDLTTFLDKKYWISFINYIIKKDNTNLIFNTNSKFGYVALPYLKAKNPTIPIIDYIHMEEWYNRNGGYSRDSSAVASVIDKTLLCNKNSEKVLKEHFKREEKELETVYIGVDEQEFDPETVNKEQVLKKYNISNDRKYIISYICRVTEQKRPYLFLKIIEKLKETRQDFRVIVAGEGNLLNSLKSKSKKKKLNDYIIFLGNVKETKDIYKISDVTLNCSVKEGLALTSYESLAMGVPVVSSDVGGQKELINNEVGEIVPCMQKETEIFDFQYTEEEIMQYVNSINKILDNIDYYKSNSRKRILNGFTINQMIEKISKIFEDTVKNPNEEKISIAKELSSNVDVLKELINMSYMANKIEYKWLCDQYNLNFYNIKPNQNEIIKERLWTNPLWRIFIKFLQKTGIMKVIKMILNRQ